MALNMHETALFRRAAVCFKEQQFMQAKQICDEILSRNKRAIEVLELVGEVLRRWQRPAEAIPYLKRATDAEPKNPRHWVTLGRGHLAAGNYADAIPCLERAHRLNPNDPYCHTILADTFQKRDQPEKARKLLQPYIDTGKEDAIMAGVWAVMETEAGRPQVAVDLIRKHQNRGPLPYGMFFMLGKAYEKLGDADNSFEAYQRANSAIKSTFDLNQYINSVEEIVKVFAKENLKRLPRSQVTSELPIFVTGRPRSGTTLVEKILNAHPAIHGAGALDHLRRIALAMGHEMGSTENYPQSVLDLEQEDVDRYGQFYIDHLQSVSKGAKRVVDKTMGMNFNMGLIELFMPKARVIWVRRNPVDNCFACYTEDMVYSHTYAQDLRHLGISYWFYEKGMRHWQNVLDLRILEVQYEELVENQEETTRKIIDFTGLEWNDACLRFHETKKFAARSTAIPTHSNAQVRKPMYKTSVGRAERFRKHLQPLFDALAEGEAMVKGALPLPAVSDAPALAEEIATRTG